MEKILVTGGLGFQGTHLTQQLLREGHNIFVLNTPSVDAQRNLAWLLAHTPEASIGENLHLLWGSVTEIELLERIIPQCSTVFHLAAKINVDESIQRPDSFLDTNVKGTANVLNWALKNKTRVILASTCEVYGGGENIDEDAMLNPKSPYAASKTAAERLAYAYAQTYGLKVDIVRPFNVFGPLQKAGGHGAVIAIFFQRIMNDEEIEIHGDGEQARDFIYIEDVARGYLEIFKNPRAAACNVYTFGSGIPTTVNQIVEHIERITGKKVKKRHVGERPGQVRSFIAKNSLRTYFDQERITPFEEGLRKYYAYVIAAQRS